MKRDRLIQRCVFVAEITTMGGCICLFQMSRLKCSHLQWACSGVLFLSSAIRSTEAYLVMRWCERPACTLWVQGASKRAFQLCTKLCLQLCCFCRQCSLGLGLKRHPRRLQCQVDTNLHVIPCEQKKKNIWNSSLEKFGPEIFWDPWMRGAKDV